MNQMDRLPQRESPLLCFATERPVVGRMFVAHRDGLVLATKLANPPEGPAMDAKRFVASMRHEHGVLAELKPVPEHQWPFSRLMEAFAAEDLVDLSSLSEFSRSVMKATARIPPGKVWTYGDVAEHIGDRKAAVAVGQAMKDNPAPLVIPCHRVVGAGKLGGWVYGQDLKSSLLAHEGINLPSGSVRSSSRSASEALVATEPSLEERIRRGESQRMEFKSTAGWRGHRIGDHHEIVRSVCGFLNAKGGELIIGVADDGSPVGIDRDHPQGQPFSGDKYQLFITVNLLRPHLTQPLAGLVDIRLEEYGGKTVCVVDVKPSPDRPVYAQPLASDGDSWGTPDDNKWICWVREGPATHKYEGPRLGNYIQRRWSKS